MKKATFTERLLAFFLDGIIILLIAGLLTTGFTNKKLEKLQEELETTITNYMQGGITMEQYLEQTQDLTYQIQKQSVSANSVQVIISIGYFVVFAYLNKGQTLGKKAMKLKVVNNEEKSPTILQMVVRTSIINQILPDIILIFTVMVVPKQNFLSIYSLITTITYIFMIASTLMILYRKDKLGLHDIIAKTKVMKEGRENE